MSNNPLALPSNLYGSWSDMVQIADVMVKSGFLPENIKTKEQALGIIMLGYELGLKPFQSIGGIDLIKGRPTLKPATMLALIYGCKDAEKVVIDAHDTHCTVTMKRKGMPEHTTTFSMKDAERITTSEGGQSKKLSEKYNYKSMPKVMLQWRAVAQCARAVFPDVIQGLYTADELGEDVGYDDIGEIVISTPQSSQTAPILASEYIQVDEQGEPILAPQNGNKGKANGNGKVTWDGSVIQAVRALGHPAYQVGAKIVPLLNDLLATDRITSDMHTNEILANVTAFLSPEQQTEVEKITF